MSNFLKLPGLIDIHVHLRDPGATHKEDFYTGTCAALAGGVTTVFDMPNNLEPILTYEKLREKVAIVKKKAVCNWGLYFGTDGRNFEEFEKVEKIVVGLKVYLNFTTGNLKIDNEELMEEIFYRWSKDKIIVAHAEEEKLDLAIALQKKYKNKLHITHIAKALDLEKIIKAKKDGLNITCDVTPHHLFLAKERVNTENVKDTLETGKPYNRLGSGRQSRFNRERHDSPEVNKSDKPSDSGGIRKELVKSRGLYKVKPPLATKEDQAYLWQSIKMIDCIATDHAPHTMEEKRSDNPPTGLPGLETMLPLLLTAVYNNRLTIEEVIRLTNTNPQKIFGFKQEKDTFIEVDSDEEWVIKNEDLKTKCGWSPFEGWRVKGKVKKVSIRGTKVFEYGKILSQSGFGKNILD